MSQRMGFRAVPQLLVVVTVVNVQVTLGAKAFPARSFTPVVAVAVYRVLLARGLLGVRVAVKVVAL